MSVKPIRVLQVVGGMNRAGTETWLMNVLRLSDRSRLQMDFLVHTTKPGAYDEEIRALGSDIIPCLDAGRPWRYARNLSRVLRQCGPYDVVHAHVHDFSGLVMRVAYLSGVPVRIAHSHNDTLALRAAAGPFRRLYLKLMERWIACYATAGLAASRQCAPTLFGPQWEADPRWRVLYCGVRLDPTAEPVDAAAVRAELGLPQSALVVGHVGRFQEQKNHGFLLDIFAEVAQREPEAWLLLVGEGPLRPEVEQKVRDLGLTDRVVFAGVRGDVPRLMQAAMDVFVFPSRCEGLGLVLVEAQAANLPCLASDAIPEEAIVVNGLVRRLPLRLAASEWAEAVLSFRKMSRPISPAQALAQVGGSPLNIATSARNLESFYGECVGRAA